MTVCYGVTQFVEETLRELIACFIAAGLIDFLEMISYFLDLLKFYASSCTLFSYTDTNFRINFDDYTAILGLL